MEAKVKLRESNSFVDVNITDVHDPEISKAVTDKWQSIIDIIARMLNVPAGLIMKISDTHMEVFLKSSNDDNPYPSNGKDLLGHGLYCETVIGTNQELEVDNSLKYDKWKDNPDIKIGMISYYGLPIKWDENKFFGTICVLDNKTNIFSNDYKELLSKMRDAIEADLAMLKMQESLKQISIKDYLTKAYNRLYLSEKMEELISKYKEQNISSAIIIFDFDSFKSVNDNYGHIVGDQALIKVVDIIKRELKSNGMISRFGGDEFVITLEGVDLADANTFIEIIYKKIQQDNFLKEHKVEITIGVSMINKDLCDYDSIISNADFQMLEKKQQKKQGQIK